MGKYNYSLHYVLSIFTCILLISCANTSDVVGKWREVGKTATLVFWKDGRFKAVDNQGMAVSGTYILLDNGTVRFEIDRQGFSPEVVEGKISMQGGELILMSGDGSEVDRYTREK